MAGLAPRSDPSGPGEHRTLGYANLTGRPPGHLITLASLLLPKVAAVRSQIAPYARAWHESNERELGGRRRRWVVLGDSMSTGIGASTPFDGWVGQTISRLHDDHLRPDVINLAAYGARVRDVIDQQLPAWRALPPAPAGEVVTVMVGANDLIRRAFRTALPAAYRELLPLLPAGSIVARMPQSHGTTAAVNDEIERAASRHGLRVVDLNSGGRTSWRGQLAGDHFHPNDAGYAVISAAFAPALERALASGDG